MTDLCKEYLQFICPTETLLKHLPKSCYKQITLARNRKITFNPSKIYLLTKGAIQVHYKPTNATPNQMEANYRQSEGFFGLFDFGTIKTTKPTAYYQIDKQSIFQLFKKHHFANLKLLQSLAYQLQQTETLLTKLQYKLK